MDMVEGEIEPRYLFLADVQIW